MLFQLPSHIRAVQGYKLTTSSQKEGTEEKVFIFALCTRVEYSYKSVRFARAMCMLFMDDEFCYYYFK